MTDYTRRRRPKPTDLADQAKKAGMTQALLRALLDGSVTPTASEKSKMEKIGKKRSGKSKEKLQNEFRDDR